MLYDTDGFKSPNTSGKDLRAINVLSLGSTCAFEIAGVCYTAPFFPEPLTKAECEEIADLGYGNKKEWCGGWQNDYWAGAIKACGGVNKVPTSSQVAEIANYVYNTSDIEARNNVYNLTLDYDKVAELGFTTQDSYFFVWSNEESNSIHAYNRYFGPTYTYGYIGRSYSNRQAVCLGD